MPTKKELRRQLENMTEQRDRWRANSDRDQERLLDLDRELHRREMDLEDARADVENLMRRLQSINAAANLEMSGGFVLDDGTQVPYEAWAPTNERMKRVRSDGSVSQPEDVDRARAALLGFTR